MLELYDLAGAEEDLRLSPFCWRTRMALAHKGLPVTAIPWRYVEKDRIAPSGQGRVPVLVDGGRWIADSWAIANHFEDSYPEHPSLFGGPVGRALSRFYNNWADVVLHGGLIRIVALDVWKHLHEKDKDYFRRSREERFGKSLEAMVADREDRLPAFRDSLQPLRMTLQAQPFLGGAAPLYPDYIIFGGFQWARTICDFELLAPQDPVALWRQRMLALFDGLAATARGYRVSPWPEMAR